MRFCIVLDSDRDVYHDAASESGMGRHTFGHLSCAGIQAVLLLSAIPYTRYRTALAVRCTGQLETTFLADRCPSNVRMSVQASLPIHTSALRAYHRTKSSACGTLAPSAVALATNIRFARVRIPQSVLFNRKRSFPLNKI